MKPENARGGFLRLSTNSAVFNANGDYSVTPGIFQIGPPANEIWSVRRLLPFIADDGQMSPQEYGNTGSALSVGIVVRVTDGSGAVLADLTGVSPVKNNGEWAAMCHDIINVGVGSGGNDAYSARWTFASDYGEPLRLIGEKGHMLQVVFNDDLSGLTEHLFRAPARLEAP